MLYIAIKNTINSVIGIAIQIPVSPMIEGNIMMRMPLMIAPRANDIAKAIEGFMMD